MRRPVEVRILIFILVIFSSWNTFRVIHALSVWDILEQYHLQVHPMYLVVSGGVWCIVGACLAIACWLCKHWSWKATIIAVAGYTSWSLLERLILQSDRSNDLFIVIIALILLLFISFILISPNIRSYFHEK